VVVTWDQRGAGLSFSKDVPPETMTIEQFITDGHELVEYLKERFGAEKIYVMGHSWGTVIGTRLIDRYPEDFYAYVGIGQVVNKTENERISYEYVYGKAVESGNGKAIRELEEVGPPVNGVYGDDPSDLDGLMIQRKWLTKLGGGLYNKTSYIPYYATYILSPEYSIFDSLNVLKGKNISLEQMLTQLLEVDLFSEIPSVDVPVYFFSGRHDYNTPFELVEEYYEALEAPKKELVWFEESAHYMIFAEPEKLAEELIAMKNEVLRK